MVMFMYNFAKKGLAPNPPPLPPPIDMGAKQKSSFYIRPPF